MSLIFADNGKLEGVYVRDSNFEEGKLMAKPRDAFIPCDKVILALGANTAPLVKRMLNVNVPIVGVKGYTFDIVASDKPSDLPLHDKCLFVGEKGWYFTVAPLEEGRWRVSSFGDIVEQQNLVPDSRRVE